jgi:hypothetical protein
MVFKRSSLISVFCRDEAGSIDLGAYLLVVTIVGIGIIVGLTTVRDQIVQEFGDLSLALENIKQSYSVTINGTTSIFVDDDGGDDPGGADDDNPADQPDAEPAGISVQQPAIEESAGGEGGAEEEG